MLILDDGLQPSVARKTKHRERTVTEFKPFPASRELVEYQNSTTARARSMYLNKLIHEKTGTK